MSRVYWHMGQALLPEHFYAQEEGLREELGAHFGIRTAPVWGVSRLQWDEFRLRKGTVALQQLTLLLRSGILIDIPGNSSPAQLDLSVAGVTRARVYLHLQTDHEIVVERSDDAADTSGIERIVQKIELSTKAYSDTSAEVFALAELACGADGMWALSPDFCPALSQIGAEPFFRGVLTRMDAVAKALRELLKKELSENYLAAEGQATAKGCLRGLYGFETFLVDVRSGIRPHPYTVFRTLRELYLDVCMFRDVHPDKLTHAYNHEDLARCIAELLEELERQVQIVRAELPYVEFLALDGRQECTFDQRLRRAKDVYFLVQKPSVSAQLDLRRVKLAAASRIQAVHQRALRGIPFERLDRPPFVHGLASTVEFFMLRPGEEWDYAVSEGKLVLYDSPQLQGCRLYLYWRES
ncbi:MAG TPA: type VI secretion system baseplate subunit TssK [Polyangiales bacterium]|nr:type VI secretion system baseplate subunit TssK [Polyangiales bacterium]